MSPSGCYDYYNNWPISGGGGGGAIAIVTVERRVAQRVGRRLLQIVGIVGVAGRPSLCVHDRDQALPGIVNVLRRIAERVGDGGRPQGSSVVGEAGLESPRVGLQDDPARGGGIVRILHVDIAAGIGGRGHVVACVVAVLCLVPQCILERGEVPGAVIGVLQNPASGVGRCV